MDTTRGGARISAGGNLYEDFMLRGGAASKDGRLKPPLAPPLDTKEIVGIQGPDLNLGHVVTGAVGNRNIIYQEMVDAAVSSFTPDQRIVFEAIKFKIDSGEGGLLFLGDPVWLSIPHGGVSKN